VNDLATPVKAHPKIRLGLKETLARGLSLETVWVFMAIALPIIALLGPKLSTIDLAYQIRAGQIMLDSHRLLTKDVFTFTAAGTPWLNQQWGAQVIFAAVFRAGGWPLLISMRALLAGCIYSFVFLACRSCGLSPKKAAILTLGSLAVSFGGLILRPQLLGLTLFALVLWLLVKRVEHPSWTWAIPFVVFVWANVHGSFFLGPLLLGLAYLEDRYERRPSRGAGIVALVSILAANLNPFGYRVWLYALGIPRNPVIANTIVEWRPPSVRSVLGFLFFLSAAAVYTLLARQGRRVPWPSLLTLVIFFFIGLFAVRGIFWWALVAPVVVASQLDSSPASSPANRGLPALNWALVLIVVMIGAASLPWWRTARGDGRLLDHAPVALTEALRGVPGEERMFNPQIWGSWFELALPERKAFVDPRIEVFNESIWHDYDAVSAASTSWQSILDRWSIQVVVASWRQQRQLIGALHNAHGWRLIYEDRDGAIFSRFASG
jgi:hypothetical protein